MDMKEAILNHLFLLELIKVALPGTMVLRFRGLEIHGLWLLDTLFKAETLVKGLRL